MYEVPCTRYHVRGTMYEVRGNLGVCVQVHVSCWAVIFFILIGSGRVRGLIHDTPSTL